MDLDASPVENRLALPLSNRHLPLSQLGQGEGELKIYFGPCGMNLNSGWIIGIAELGSGSFTTLRSSALTPGTTTIQV